MEKLDTQAVLNMYTTWMYQRRSWSDLEENVSRISVKVEETP